MHVLLQSAHGPEVPGGSPRRSTSPRRWLPVLGLALVLPFPAASQASQTPPCATPDHRAFDFWVGEWDVYNPSGQQVGTNSIQLAMNGCVLHERYDGRQGFHGESFNTFDGSRGVWHQTWVDTGGTLLLIEGGIRDGAMVLEGTTRRPDGTPVLNRITWTVLDGSGDRIRQHWQVSTDGGENWSTTFDGEYRRRGGSRGTPPMGAG